MSKYGKPRSSKGLATLCAKLAEDKLANDILILNLEDIEFAPTDYFVICSCDTEIQVAAVLEYMVNTTKSLKIQKPHIEGETNKEWVLVDYFDVVVHIMKKEIRNYYRLEKLWGKAQFLKLSDDGKPLVMKFEDIKPFLKESIVD